jgi:hypothetical protein
VARTALEDRQQILADLAIAIDQLAVATACLAQAYEQLDESTADRLEQELFRPAQKALGRAKRTYGQFAGRVALPAHEFEAAPSAGLPSQGVKRFVERAAEACAEAGGTVAALQDSMLPIEAGDPELRVGLAEVRELIDEVPGRAREFLRTLGR